MEDRVKIFGVEIDNLTLDEIGEKTKRLVNTSNKNCNLIVAPNVEFIMQAQKDREFFDILKSAKLATPDSVGVTLAGKKQKKPFKERIPGQSYLRKVFEVGEKEGWTFYLLGGEGDVPKKAKEHLEGIYPKAKIVGVHEGFFKEDSEEKVIEEINSLKPNVLFVAMGAPMQEKWIYENRNKLKVDIAAGQGGTFDYEAGTVKRAPVWMQKCGIEWLWRLIKEPKRIKRMVVLPIFFLKVVFSKDVTKGKFE